MKPAEVLALSEDTAALRLAEDEAARWYNERLPENVCECPREVQTTAEYQHADIDSMLASAAELDIDPVKEPYLLWIPRMQVAMGLPQFWRRKILDGNVVYYSLQHDVVCRTHPGKQFWDRFVDRIRELAATVDRRSLGTNRLVKIRSRTVCAIPRRAHAGIRRNRQHFEKRSPQPGLHPALQFCSGAVCDPQR